MVNKNDKILNQNNLDNHNVHIRLFFFPLPIYHEEHGIYNLYQNLYPEPGYILNNKDFHNLDNKKNGKKRIIIGFTDVPCFFHFAINAASAILFLIQ